MNGVMEDARLILEYKKHVEKNHDFSKNAIAEWKETAKDSGFYKRLSDFSFGDNNSYGCFGGDAYAVSSNEKIITVKGIRQKVYSKKYRNFKIELSAVLNEEADEFEIYLGKKTDASQKYLFSFTRFRNHNRHELIPVSAYETLFDFDPEFLKTHSEYLQKQFQKNLEEHKTYIFERENEQNGIPHDENYERKQLDDEFDYLEKKSKKLAKILLKDIRILVISSGK